MSALRVNRRVVPLVLRRGFASAPSTESEYTATPQYPEILDLSFDKKLERKKEAIYEEIKAVKTVEEKQIKLNMPRYYGFKCYMLREDYIPYNNLTLAQHVTRTHLIESPGLPEFYKRVDVDPVLGDVKSGLEEGVLFELDGYRRMHDLRSEQLEQDEQENLISSSISRQLNRILINKLSPNAPHLVTAQVDVNARIEAVWYAGGMNPPLIVKKYREGTPWQKHRIDEPTNRVFNYLGTANVAVRSSKPLLPLVSMSEAENPDLTVPFFKFDPRTVGTVTLPNRRIANVPGFWPGDPNKFGLLSYHKRGHILTRHYNDPTDDKESLHRQGILSSFAWLSSQANFLGFTTFNDITYPLVTQTIITNGQQWSFYAYQLNTLINHSKHVTENPKRNICWATPELKLFDKIENGKLVGFNDDVVKILAQFYANAPEDRLGVNMTPYLSQEVQVSADYKDDEKREWLEREYKFLVSNRPRFKLDYEIYAWEKIYKIDNKTRFMDKKRRPFELNVNPWDRRLDERQANYTPRALRPDLPRSKGRYAPEFFP